jgi:hypothetical protein
MEKEVKGRKFNWWNEYSKKSEGNGYINYNRCYSYNKIYINSYTNFFKLKLNIIHRIKNLSHFGPNVNRDYPNFQT